MMDWQFDIINEEVFLAPSDFLHEAFMKAIVYNEIWN